MIDLENLTTPPALLSDEEFEALAAHGGPYKKLTSFGWARIDFETVNRQFPLVVRVKPVPLIKPSINWSHLPDWAQYIARDKDGRAWAYPIAPVLDNDDYWYVLGHTARIDNCHASYHPGTCDWRNSLVERPEGV